MYDILNISCTTAYMTWCSNTDYTSICFLERLCLDLKKQQFTLTSYLKYCTRSFYISTKPYMVYNTHTRFTFAPLYSISFLHTVHVHRVHHVFTFAKSIWNPGIPPTIIPVWLLKAGMTAKLGSTLKSPAFSNRNFKQSGSLVDEPTVM